MAVRFQLRRDAAANWTSANPILLDGEIAAEKDTGKFKIGDGTTAWTSLAYSSGIQGDPGADGATILTGSVDPTTEGVNGDLYINTTSYDVFKKVSGAWGTAISNIKGATGATGAGVPIGGTAGQVLSKIDGTDYNTQWSDLPIQTKAFAFYIDGDLEVGTDLMSIISPMSLTITEIRCVVSTAPTGADLIIDINKNGSSIMSTRVEIDAVGTSDDGNHALSSTTIAPNDTITFDIDQIGSTVKGSNLWIIVYCQ